MRNIAELAVANPLYTWLMALVCLFGGIYGIEHVGRLEDPSFPTKTALVITPYQGASAFEVEQEITDVMEAALQELPYIDKMVSKSLAGRSEITVDLLEEFSDDDIPQIFDELRRRVGEAAQRLPPGSGEPLVEDDYSDVYGLMYAVSAPGYSASEIWDISKYISTALKGIPDVAKVQTAGELYEALYVEIDHQRLTRLGLSIDGIFRDIAVENQVVAAGSVAFDGRRIRVAPQMAFNSVQALENMRIGQPGSTEILRLADIATVTREPVEIPPQIIRRNGERVFTVGVSITHGRNVVEVGRRVDDRLVGLRQELPLGVTMEPIYEQHRVVDRAIRDFLTNLLLSVATVVLALCVFMGWRAGTVVGMVLLLTVMGTLGLMTVFAIELQRISLGALMIAMGMLVDNGIVVAEGMVTGVKQGLTPQKAAGFAVKRTQWPLLGATIIGIAAFGPIGLSDDDSGHFLRSLFQVVCISLLLSWVLAVTVVPVLGKYLLKPGKARTEAELYSGWGYLPYRTFLGWSVRFSWIAALGIVAIVVVCFWAFQFVKPGFFPNTNSPLFYVDYRLPEGTDIRATEAEIEILEEIIGAIGGVEDITSFVGRGAVRFTTIMRPEQPNSAYSQMVIRVADVTVMDAIMAQAEQEIAAVRAESEFIVSRAEFSPGGTSKIEARFSGPHADVLRDLANKALDAYLQHDLVDRKLDWRQPRLELVPHFNESSAQVAGITRADLSQAIAFATLGVDVGLFRDGDQLIPIVARAPLNERGDVTGLMDRFIWSPAQQRHIPISRVVDRFELTATDATIYRRNRVRTITAMANPPAGKNATRTFERIRGDVEAIALPPGYSLEWGGEFESNQQANESLIARIPPALGLMFFITVLMFGRLRQPIVIWLTVPMIVCGVVIGLLATDLSFTFPAFLGFLSLSGMLIKNCVVLVDEIDKRFAEGTVDTGTLIAGSVSRLRPVLLAAGTTIAGMSPLLADAFFREMAVVIMSGLAFATLLTLIAVPVFYRLSLGKRIT